MYEEGLKRYYTRIGEDVGKFALPFSGEEEILDEFPNDVKFFDREQVKQQQRYWSGLSKEYAKRHPYRVWDKVRGDACLGLYGDVAKRCSMNDDLWELWSKSGQRLTMPELRMFFERLKAFEKIKKYPNLADEGFRDLTKNRIWENKT